MGLANYCKICNAKSDCIFCGFKMCNLPDDEIDGINYLGETYNKLLRFKMSGFQSGSTTKETAEAGIKLNEAILKHIGDWRLPGAKPFIPIKKKPKKKGRRK